MATSLLILLLFVMFVMNQTIQIVEFASRVSPLLGTALLWTLLVFYALLIAVPLVIFLRMPRSLRPVESEQSREFPLYMERLKKRLARNRLLAGSTFSDRRDVEAGLATLNRETDSLIRTTASTVFVTTAVSQSGRLDAFLVLATQSRMLWQIARLYYQRPTPRELLHLYANIAATVFLATELDDLDVHEQVEAILSSTLGSVVVAVPGTSLLVNSVVNGAANAFLTLRVGIMAKRYCSSLVLAERRTLKRAATVEAVGLLGSVVSQGTARISKTVWDVSKEKIGTKASVLANFVKQTCDDLLSKTGMRKKQTPDTEGPAR